MERERNIPVSGLFFGLTSHLHLNSRPQKPPIGPIFDHHPVEEDENAVVVQH